jgi:PAS domain S-box-containing protein
MEASIKNLPKETLQLLDNILHGIIIVDIDGQIIFWNQASENIFGYSSDQILGRSIRELYHGLSDAYSFRKDLEQFRSEDRLHRQWKARHKSGLEIWLDVRSKILRDENNMEAAYLISVCDIKPLKKVEKQLEESRAISQAIIETSVDAIITIDGKGRIQSFNKAAEKMFGYTFDEVIGENVKLLMPDPYRDKHDDYIDNYLETGDRKIIGIGQEVTAVKKNGDVFPIDLSVAEIKWEGGRIFSGIIKDISLRRKLEKSVIEIGEEERTKIGRDLHDGLGQMLTGIRMMSENLARKLKANELPGADEVQEISDMIRETDEFARSLSHGLAHVDVDKNGIQEMLQNLCKRSEKMFNINCICDISNTIETDDQTLSLNIYRIAQEAIHNAVKHGRAKKIFVRLAATERHISLIVEDDGIGFDEHFDLTDCSGMGLQLMKHRAGLLGGVLEFVKNEKGYTRVRCLIPKNTIKF